MFVSNGQPRVLDGAQFSPSTKNLHIHNGTNSTIHLGGPSRYMSIGPSYRERSHKPFIVFTTLLVPPERKTRLYTPAKKHICLWIRS